HDRGDRPPRSGGRAGALRARPVEQSRRRDRGKQPADGGEPPHRDPRRFRAREAEPSSYPWHPGSPEGRQMSRSALRVLLLVTAIAACLLAGTALWRRSNVDASVVATVHRGALTAQLTTSGILKPSESITYRSPLAGREAEIIELVAEGTRVNEGDLLVRI